MSSGRFRHIKRSIVGWTRRRRFQFGDIDLHLLGDDEFDAGAEVVSVFVAAGGDGLRFDLITGFPKLFVEPGENLATASLDRKTNGPLAAHGQRGDVKFLGAREYAAQIYIMRQP